MTVITYNDKDYISLTDMVRNMENGPALIEKWLRNKNTVEFLGIWEEMYNPEKVCRNTRCAFFFFIDYKNRLIFLSCDILRISLIYAFSTSK